MSETVETFNVKNTSLRLVHIGGVSIMPDQVIALVNDPQGINKADVNSSEYLEETDVNSSEYLEETDEEAQTEEITEVQKPKAKPVKAAAKSATGAGWSNKA